MSDWQQSVAGAVERFEARFDRLRRRLDTSIGRSGSPIVLPYRSYGTRDRLLVMGRVLENKPVAAADINDTVMQIVDFFRLQEIPPEPMFLRDWGIKQDELLPTEHSRHKLKRIWKGMVSG